MSLVKYTPFSNPNRFNPNAPWWSQTKKKLIINQTPQELEFYKLLRKTYPKLRILPQKTLKANNRRYYLDFYIPRAKLAIELDGMQHIAQKAKDEERDLNLLQDKYIITIRYSNKEFDEDPLKVVEDVLLAVAHYSRFQDFTYTAGGFKSKTGGSQKNS